MNKPKTIYSTEHERLCAWLTTKKQECGMSIRQLAERLDWSPSIVGEIFTGDRRLDVVEFTQLCKALNVDAHAGLEILTTTNTKAGKKVLKKRA